MVISPYGISQALAMLLSGVEPGGASYRQLCAAVFDRQAGGATAAGGEPAQALAALTAQLRQLSAALVKVR